MWKRLNNTKGTRQPTIGGPEYVDTEYSEKSYAPSGLGISNYRQPPDRNRPPPRPPREEIIAKGLPRLPL